MKNSTLASRRRTLKPKPITIAHEDVRTLCVMIGDILAQRITEIDLEGAFWTAWSRWALPEEVERAKIMIASRDRDSR
jgi:hypothetical protein